MLIIEEAIVAMKCRTSIKALFFYFKCNVGQSHRTITIHKCTTGMFDPINKVCDNKIDKGMERVA
jgi:hypothetical protein